MEKVRCLSAKELDSINVVYKEIGKEAKIPPLRRIKLCHYKKRGNDAFLWFLIVLEIENKEFVLFDTFKKEEATTLYYHCWDVIPCFWSVEDFLYEVFTDTVLTKLVELMRLYGYSWSVAHMCVSLPLPEDTMMILLASDSFKDHFTSTRHPKRYTLLHLAIEQNSLLACKAILRCSEKLGLDPCFYIEDQDGLLPIQKAKDSDAKECLTYLIQSQSPHEAQCSSGFLSKQNLLDQFRKAIEDKKSDTVKTLLTTDPSLVHVPNVDGSICLHKARDHMTIIHLIDNGADDSTRNQENETPLHAIIRRENPSTVSRQKDSSSAEDSQKQATKEKQSCIVALLANGKGNVNSKTKGGMTPLHLAVEGCDALAVKSLLIFGANILCVNDQDQTPLDMAKNIAYQSTIDLLQFAENDQVMSTLAAADSTDFDQTLVDDMMSSKGAVSAYPKGDRVLCLDGGGIKGLVLIEMLAVIERISGKRIVDLFDWIIGTSTGGILALALVYTDLTLNELRDMYFSLKDKVLHSIGIPHSDTETLEMILKDKVKDIKLGSKTHPRVMVTATNIKYSPPSLVFFNNFEEDDELGKGQGVLKAGRATSAAPVYFSHCDNTYIDGGIKANNPSMSGLTRIHEYYKATGRSYKIACVVSLGCGMFQKKVGDTDIHDCLSKISSIKEGILNAIRILSSVRNLAFDVILNEISETDGEPVHNTRAFCETNDISYFRLSPMLKEAIGLDEKDTEKLVDMLITTRQYVLSEINQFRAIVKNVS